MTDIQNAFFGRPVKGYEWTRASVYAILRSDLIRGYVLHYIKDDRDHRDQPIRAVDDEGNWVRRESLIDDGWCPMTTTAYDPAAVPAWARESIAWIAREHPENLAWVAEIEAAKRSLAEHPPARPEDPRDFLHLHAIEA